ncbi:ferredoxin--NADP reductase [Salinispira pacifica]
MIGPRDIPERAPRHVVSVLLQREIARGVYYLELERPFDFHPGQCVAAAIDRREPPRYYSIASGRSEPTIGILYDLVAEGALTPRLSRLQAGERIWISDPFGSFLDGEEPSVWIATGTGIAPFLSLARSLPPEVSAARKRLIHGARTADRFYFQDELVERVGAGYLRCCSQCSGESPQGVYAGRLTAWLRQAAAEGEVGRGPRYLLCGSAGMVVQVRDLLISAGVPFGDILSEIYF